VPFGAWKVWVTGVPANHFGTIIGNGSAVTAGSPLNVSVSPDPGGGVTPAPLLTLDEGQVNLTAVANRLASDPNATPPANVTVTLSRANTQITSQTVPVGTTNPAPPAVQVWLTPATYTVAVSTGAANWVLDSGSTSVTALDQTAPVNAALQINEIGASLTVHIVNAGGAAVNGATVTLTPPTGSGITAPATQQSGPPPQGVGAGNAVFTAVPFGTGWTASATSGNGANQLTGSTSFNVTSTTAQTVNVQVS
jgi:hypothetical protein